MFLVGVAERGHDDLGQVVIDQPVHHLAPGPLPGDHPGGLQDPQVLADQWLGHVEGVDRSCTQRCDSRSCRTIAMRTGAASARSSSPARSSRSPPAVEPGVAPAVGGRGHGVTPAETGPLGNHFHLSSTVPCAITHVKAPSLGL